MQDLSEKTTIKYSVLMSVYYKEKPVNLENAIKSMLNQTIKPDQFIIVEDGNLTFELYNVLDKFSEKYPDIIMRLALEESKGLGVALDKGLKMCRNELVARMDSDDISFVDRCEKQLSIFYSNPEIDILSGNIVEFDGETSNVIYRRVVPEYDKEIKKRMRTRSPFNHPAVMYKKSSVIRCGGYGNSVRKEDHDLFSRMLNMGCCAYNLQDDVLFYRTGKDSIMRRKSWKNVKSYLEIMWINLKRGYCSIWDFFYVCIAQLFYFIAPVSLVNFVLKKFYRE